MQQNLCSLRRLQMFTSTERSPVSTLLRDAQPCLARLSHAAPSKPTLSRSQHWQVVTLSAGTPHKLGTPGSTGARHHWVSWSPMVSLEVRLCLPSRFRQLMALGPCRLIHIPAIKSTKPRRATWHATWHATGPQKRPLMPGQCPMACP